MSDTDAELVTFATAASGYYAIYVPDAPQAQDAQPVLLNVVGWATLRDSEGNMISVAYVPQPYSDQLVRADAIPGFVSLIGPNPQSDHKAGATRILGEAQAHRSAQLAREANRRRRAKSHLSGKKRLKVAK
jgi:hypothetical protein